MSYGEISLQLTLSQHPVFKTNTTQKLKGMENLEEFHYKIKSNKQKNWKNSICQLAAPLCIDYNATKLLRVNAFIHLFTAIYISFRVELPNLIDVVIIEICHKSMFGEIIGDDATALDMQQRTRQTI